MRVKKKIHNPARASAPIASRFRGHDRNNVVPVAPPACHSECPPACHSERSEESRFHPSENENEEHAQYITDSVEQIIGDSFWLARRRPILMHLFTIADSQKSSKAMRFRALNLIFKLMEKAEKKDDVAFAPTQEAIREAIEILNKYVD